MKSGMVIGVPLGRMQGRLEMVCIMASIRARMEDIINTDQPLSKSSAMQYGIWPATVDPRDRLGH